MLKLFFFADDDLDAMYLSDKKDGNHREDHEELELLLESFSKQVEEIVNEAETIEVCCYLSLAWAYRTSVSFRETYNRRKKLSNYSWILIEMLCLN